MQQNLHEMGHALDIRHSFSNDPWIPGGSEYNDEWDLMGSGVAVHGMNLDRLGWLRRDQVAMVGIDGGTGGVYRLKPLYSSATGTKLIRVPYDTNDPFLYYTVELRTRTGWDNGIPADVVLIHETRKHSDGGYYSYLRRKTTSTTTTVCVPPPICTPKACNPICTTTRTPSTGSGAPDQSVFSNGRWMITVAPIDSVNQQVDVTVSLPSSLLPTARASFGANTCKSPFVWREADQSDYVCSTTAIRSQTALENLNAWQTRNPSGGPYGPDTCLNGYVWREAFAGDHVCVLPSSRTQAATDNQQAVTRIAVP